MTRNTRCENIGNSYYLLSTKINITSTFSLVQDKPVAVSVSVEIAIVVFVFGVLVLNLDGSSLIQMTLV
jgi:hypothetical protein